MKRLSLYLTRTYTNMEIETDIATRATSGRCVADVLDNMQETDRAAVAALAAAIVDYCTSPTPATRALLEVGR